MAVSWWLEARGLGAIGRFGARAARLYFVGGLILAASLHIAHFALAAALRAVTP